MATDQKIIIPEGWRPTIAEPLPVQRCTTIKKNGERCRRWSLRGCAQCASHGARLPRVKEHAEAMVEAARLRLTGMTDGAVDVIEDLMINGTAEKIRLDAAKEVLDRAGVKGPVEIDVTVTQGESAAQRARRKLEETAERLQATVVQPSPSTEIVLAEIDTDTAED